MERLDKNSDLFSRYVKMFGQQEDLIAKNRDQIKTIVGQEDKLQKELTEFLTHLNVE
jgi:hypothetical protein